LRPNTSGVEGSGAGVFPTATGFTTTAYAGLDCIYIAIRRGPMRTPTIGTSVFSPTLATFSGTAVTNTGFVVDMAINKTGVASTSNNFVLDRLRGSDNGAAQQTISTNSTSAEVASSGRVALTGSVTIQNGFLEQDTTANNIVWAFGRAPGFFDEVCYTGNGSTQTITHNLGVAPELIIAKNRGQAGNNWPVLFNFTPTTLGYGFLNTTTAENNQTYAYVAALASAPTATTFSLVNSSSMNASGFGIVAYLFASCPGVSKVGLYTGTGATQVINCGFTAGSRFVMIKRADGSGDWYVWDSARGIVAGNDPYLLLNSTAAEVTNTDFIDTASTGFEISSTAPAAINASGGTFIFLAIS
jgi:hypothetical protein